MNPLIDDILQYVPSLVEEANRITVYHGDNYGLKSINGNYSLMSLEGSNQQEGPGIYWSTNIKTAQAYGTHVVETTVDPKKFMKSRVLAEKYFTVNTLTKILIEISKNDEEYWYILTDYAVYVTEPEDVEPYHWAELAEMMMSEQVRNLLITLEEKTDTENFVKAFTKHCKYFGTYTDDNVPGEVHYAMLKNDDEVRPT